MRQQVRQNACSSSRALRGTQIGFVAFWRSILQRLALRLLQQITKAAETRERLYCFVSFAWRNKARTCKLIMWGAIVGFQHNYQPIDWQYTSMERTAPFNLEVSIIQVNKRKIRTACTTDARSKINCMGSSKESALVLLFSLVRKHRQDGRISVVVCTPPLQGLE